ncbi:MAG: hypothetical protein ACXWCW_30015 [Burkholderiales bacterium]
MKRTWSGVATLTVVAALLISLSSCARDQKLVSITLQPSEGFVFEGFNAQGQFTALGTYEHPPETKDITDKVVWTLDIANFGTLTPTGQITYTRTDGCGSGNVTATFYSNPNNPTAGSAITASAPVKGSKDGSSTCQ